LTLGDGGHTGSGGAKMDTKTVDIDLAPLSSAQIDAVRGAADGSVDLPIRSALVTYTKPAVGADPAGFFVQAERDGPALFVAVDPATLIPSPAAEDLVSLTVTGKSTVNGMVRATGVSGLTVHSQDNPLAPLLADVSAVADLPSVLGDYESEYVSVSGTLTSSFSSSGTGHSSASLATAGTLNSANLRLRVTNTVLDQLDLVQGCSVTAVAPLWRSSAQAQPSAWASQDLTGVSCPAPEVTEALATSSTAVTVRFDRQIASSSVEANGSQFTFDNGLAATGATVSGREVRLTTGTQTAGAAYTVTVASSVRDTLGEGVGAENMAGFTGFDPTAVLRITEIAPDLSSGRDLVEFVAVQGGNTEGQKLVQGTSELATLPEARVATGDVIVLHLNPDAQNGDAPASETLAKAQFPNATYSSNYDTAWDFHGGTSSVTYSNQVLRVKDATGATQDALAVTRSGFTTSAYPAQLQALQAEGAWQPSDCGGAPCTYSSFPTAQGVSADWSGLPTTWNTTLYRISGQDSDQRSDWTVGAHSLGLSNP